MKSQINKKLSKKLIFLNVTLAFAIASVIGANIVGADIKFFDEPAKETSYVLNSNSPYTAQFPEYKEQITSTVTPENPGPNENVEITLEVYSFDINSAQISWKRDGILVSKGIGKKKFSFINGNLGVSTKIEAIIDPKDRPIITEIFTLTPGEVDLLWQANTYTPPFYKGKSLYTPEASVLLVALPKSENGLIKPEETIFNWTENYSRQADRSGFGKNTYTYEGPIILRDARIKVEARTPKSGSISSKEVSTKEITLRPQSARIFMYEDNPATGILFNTPIINSLELNKPEIKLVAYPYFQTTPNKNTGLEYTWVIDNNRIDIPKEQNSITLKKTGGQKGMSNVTVQIKNPFKILQTTTQTLLINFENKETNKNTSQFGQ